MMSDISNSPFGLRGVFTAPRGNDPTSIGITNTYNPTLQATLVGRILDAIQDPRNSWMGMGMAGGAARRFGQGLAGDLGGFAVPTRDMQVRYPVALPEARQTYLQDVKVLNQSASQYASDDPLQHIVGRETYDASSEQRKKLLEDTMLGRHLLKDELHNATNPRTGGAPPNEHELRRFGFGK